MNRGKRQLGESSTPQLMSQSDLRVHVSVRH